MAGVTASTHVETWQELPAQANTIFFTHLDGSKLCGQDFPTRLERTGAAAIHKSTNAHNTWSNEPLSVSNLHRLEKHEFYHSEPHVFKMVHSSQNNSQTRVSHDEEAGQRRRREATYDVSSRGPYSNHNHPRVGSAYSSNRELNEESQLESIPDSKEQQLRAREKVTRLRRQVVETRLSKRRKRVKIRELRENVQASLDRLTQHLNLLIASKKVPAELGPLHDQLRATQDHLGPAEYDYEELENRLEEEEDDLELEEEKLDDLYEDDSGSDTSNSGSGVDFTNSLPTKSSNISEASIQTLDSDDDILQKYLFLIDQALESRIELQNLEDEYVGRSGEASIRRRNGYPITEAITAVLSNYTQDHHERLDQINRIEKYIYDLREECLKQGIFQRDEYLYEPRDALRDDLMGFVQEALERSPLHFAAQHVSNSKVMPSKQDYVNSWLLQMVQESTLDMMMLRSSIYIHCPGISETPDKTLVQMGDDKWTQSSIAHWYTDTAGVNANANLSDSKSVLVAEDTKNSNTSNIRWSLSTYSSIHVGLDYNHIVNLIIVSSEKTSDTIQKDDQDIPSTKSNSEQCTTSSAAPDINKRKDNPEGDRHTGTTIPVGNFEPEYSYIRTSPAEILVSVIPDGLQELTSNMDDSKDLPIPDKPTDMFTARCPSSSSNPIAGFESRLSSICNTQASPIDASRPISEHAITPPPNHKSRDVPSTRPKFLDTPTPSLSRSRSLITLRSSAHPLREDDFGKSIPRTRTYPLEKVSSERLDHHHSISAQLSHTETRI